MKQTLAAITLLLILPIPLPAEGVDIEIGATTAYNRWDPAWNNEKIIMYPPDMIKIVDTNAPSYPPLEFASYGPHLAVRFAGQWELSSSFHYGFVSTKGGGVALIPDLVYRRFKYAIKLYDVHAGLSYLLFDMMKLFAGVRTEITDYTVSYRHSRLYLPVEVFRTTMEGRSLHFTPEIGIGVVVPISPILGIHASLAGTFQSGSQKANYKNSFSQSGPEFKMQRIPAARYYGIGLNSSISLRCAIPVINTTISFGGFYRLLRYMQKSSRRGIHDLDGSLDQIFGCSASVSYHFSFAEKKSHRVWIPRPRYDQRLH